MAHFQRQSTGRIIKKLDLWRNITKAETQYNNTPAAQGQEPAQRQEYNNKLEHDTQHRSQQIKMKALFAAAYTSSSQQTSTTPPILPPLATPMFYDLLRERKRDYAKLRGRCIPQSDVAYVAKN